MIFFITAVVLKIISQLELTYDAAFRVYNVMMRHGCNLGSDHPINRPTPLAPYIGITSSVISSANDDSSLAPFQFGCPEFIFLVKPLSILC